MKKDEVLPKGVYFKSGSYYVVFRNKWHRLGRKPSDVTEEAISEIKGGDSDKVLATYVIKKFSLIRSGAKQRGIDFSISIDDALSLGKDQRWRCAVTNLAFSIKRVDGMRTRPYAPSIDRINHNGVYEPGNIRLVCNAVNVARSNLPDDIFMHIVVSAGINLASIARAMVRGNQKQ